MEATSATSRTTEASPQRRDSAVSAKVDASVALLVLTAVLVFLPICAFKSCRKRFAWSGISDSVLFRVLRNHGVSALNCFAGGVFLATSFLHILVEAQEEVAMGLHEAGVKSAFPLANMLVMVGVLLVMTIEQTASYFEDKNRQHNQESQNLLPSEITFQSTRSRTFEEAGGSPSTEQQGLSSSVLSCLILTIALSVHSIFEGMAIGLQKSSEAVFSLLAVVSIHKVVVTVSLGLNLSQIRGKLLMPAIYSIIYSFAAPVGIVLGLLVSDLASELVAGILHSLACGTFIFVAVFEILPREMERKNRSRILCIVAFAIGLTLVALTTFFSPHTHTHTHDHDPR